MYLVVFIATLSDDRAGYQEMADHLRLYSAQQPGLLDFYVVTQEAKEIAVSVWRDMASIEKWKNDKKHQIAKSLGKERWLDDYELYITRVETHHKEILRIPQNPV